jgi:hypothetical protein
LPRAEPTMKIRVAAPVPRTMKMRDTQPTSPKTPEIASALCNPVRMLLRICSSPAGSITQDGGDAQPPVLLTNLRRRGGPQKER